MLESIQFGKGLKKWVALDCEHEYNDSQSLRRMKKSACVRLKIRTERNSGDFTLGGYILMKKMMVMAVALVMALSLAACSSSDNSTSTAASSTVSSTSEASSVESEDASESSSVEASSVAE